MISEKLKEVRLLLFALFRELQINHGEEYFILYKSEDEADRPYLAVWYNSHALVFPDKQNLYNNLLILVRNISQSDTLNEDLLLLVKDLRSTRIKDFRKDPIVEIEVGNRLEMEIRVFDGDDKGIVRDSLISWILTTSQYGNSKS